MRRNSGLINALYAAIFLDLFGFGMIIPDIQLRAEKLGAAGWLIGAMLASTFVIQIPASPQWGKISDRTGRKPILLVCTAFSAGGMFVYGLAHTIPILIASRMLSGLGGANVAIAQAMLADGTEKEGRTAAMGRIGAAVSMGLIGGPVAGGLTGHYFGSAMVGFIAAGCSALGGILILTVIPNLRPEVIENRKKTPFLDLGLLRDLPQVRALVVVASVAWFSLATLEGTFGRLIEHTLDFGDREFGIVFGYESLLGFLIQAFAMAWIARKTSDAPLLRVAYLLQGLGLALTPFTYLFPVHAAWFTVLLGVTTLYAVGSSLANPTINSLCSKLTPDARQGELFGLMQGSRSVGFILGPIIGGALFDQWFAAPYFLAGITCVVAAGLIPRPRPP